MKEPLPSFISHQVILSGHPLILSSPLTLPHPKWQQQSIINSSPSKHMHALQARLHQIYQKLGDLSYHFWPRNNILTSFWLCSLQASSHLVLYIFFLIQACYFKCTPLTNLKKTMTLSESVESWKTESDQFIV